jgi:hypothetical protein
MVVGPDQASVLREPAGGASCLLTPASLFLRGHSLSSFPSYSFYQLLGQPAMGPCMTPKCPPPLGSQVSLSSSQLGFVSLQLFPGLCWPARPGQSWGLSLDCLCFLHAPASPVPWARPSFCPQCVAGKSWVFILLSIGTFKTVFVLWPIIFYSSCKVQS